MKDTRAKGPKNEESCKIEMHIGRRVLCWRRDYNRTSLGDRLENAWLRWP